MRPGTHGTRNGKSAPREGPQKFPGIFSGCSEGGPRGGREFDPPAVHHQIQTLGVGMCPKRAHQIRRQHAVGVRERGTAPPRPSANSRRPSSMPPSQRGAGRLCRRALTTKPARTRPARTHNGRCSSSHHWCEEPQLVRPTGTCRPSTNRVSTGARVAAGRAARDEEPEQGRLK